MFEREKVDCSSKKEAGLCQVTDRNYIQEKCDVPTQKILEHRRATREETTKVPLRGVKEGRGLLIILELGGLPRLQGGKWKREATGGVLIRNQNKDPTKPSNLKEREDR